MSLHQLAMTQQLHCQHACRYTVYYDIHSKQNPPQNLTSTHPPYSPDTSFAPVPRVFAGGQVWEAEAEVVAHLAQHATALGDASSAGSARRSPVGQRAGHSERDGITHVTAGMNTDRFGRMTRVQDINQF